MNTEIIALYPGSFDPLTNGHLDIVKKAGRMFPKLIVAVTENLHKNHFFSLPDRIEMLKESSKNLPNVEITTFSGLLADYFDKINATVLIRGLRAVSDFEYEFQMALMNKKLNGKIETIFLMPDQDYTFLSSSMIKEIALLGGNTKDFVPTCVEKKLKQIKK